MEGGGSEGNEKVEDARVDRMNGGGGGGGLVSPQAAKDRKG